MCQAILQKTIMNYKLLKIGFSQSDNKVGLLTPTYSSNTRLAPHKRVPDTQNQVNNNSIATIALNIKETNLMSISIKYIYILYRRDIRNFKKHSMLRICL